MAGPIYGQGFIDLYPQLSAGFTSTLTGLLGPAGARIAEVLKSPIAIGVGAGIVAGIGLANLGESFDEAFDTIRSGTGATGDALEGLKDDFREVFASVPTQMGPAATAISDLHRRLGLTGEPLQDLAAQFLELSRITGSDLQADIASVTRTFGDWSIVTGEQSGALDTLFRASQQTGVTVDTLAQSLVKYGAPLRQLGFTFEESTALIGKFEKEGVNTELVLGSMRIALGKMARAGEDSTETFQRVIGEIQNAGTVSEANALALELFGARAGPDMAAAIREGRFEIGELTAAITDTGETVMGAAADTADWRESWTLFTNNLKLVVEPVASAVFGALGELMGGLAGFITGIRDAMADPSSGLGQTFRVIGEIFGEVGAVIGDIIATLQALWAEWGDEITRIVTTVFGNLSRIIGPILDGIRAIISTILALIRGDWDAVWDGIRRVFSAVWDGIKAVVAGAVESVKLTISLALAFITGIWNRVWEGLGAVVSRVFDTAVAVVRGAVNLLLGLLESLINAALRGLQLAIDAADVLAGPFINFPDEVFTPISIARLHLGGLAEDEQLRILQRGELVVPAPTTSALFDALENLGGGDGTATTSSGRGLFDGATLVFQGTPDEQVERVGRRVGLEVRWAQ